MCKKCVLFDIDFTLLQSAEFHRESFIKSFDETFGIKLNKKDTIKFFIKNSYLNVLIDVAKENKIILDENKINTFFNNLIENMKKFPSERIEYTPGIPKILEILKEKNIDLIVYTGNMEKIGNLLLSKKDLKKYFVDFIFTNLGETKPNALKRQKSKIKKYKKIFVIGDSLYDLKAAKENGYFSINVLTGIIKDKEIFEKYGSDLIVKSLNDDHDKVIEFIESK